MKVKFTWLLTLKIFIVLFWTLGMAGFIFETIDNRKTFLELLAHWDKALIFMVILLGCLSIILDFSLKKERL